MDGERRFSRAGLPDEELDTKPSIIVTFIIFAIVAAVVLFGLFQGISILPVLSRLVDPCNDGGPDLIPLVYFVAMLYWVWYG